MTTRGSEIPGPKSHWLFGLLREFLGDTLGFLQRVESDFGPVAKFRILRATNYLINDPELIEVVLKNKSGQFIKNRGFFRHFYDIFGNGLLTSEGEQWRRQRKLMSPIFSSSALEMYLAKMVSCTAEVTNQWADSFEVAFHPLAMQLTSRIAMETLFGVQDSEVGGHVYNAVRTLEKQIAVRIGRPFLFQDYLPNKNNIEYKRALRTIDHFIGRLIDQNNMKDGSVISVLKNARHEDGKPIEKSQIRDECITLFLAGHESTSILISWTLYLVATNRDILSGLREEWEDQNCSGDVSVSRINNMKLTLAVINEALRLFPPAYIIGRETLEEISFKGMKIPKGSPIVISPYVLGRSSKLFNNPQSFLPERWLNGSTKQLSRFSFIPFGGGQRVCIGERFAVFEAAIIIREILKDFDVVYAGDSPPTPLTSINMPPKNDMPLKFSKRS